MIWAASGYKKQRCGKEQYTALDITKMSSDLLPEKLCNHD